ncbi:hypothetical protein HY495_00910 [Candidatus Woesearchaeota archaeon]|nr:hypothetical protein [Candidatus Woesearchaeota archaeon]
MGIQFVDASKVKKEEVQLLEKELNLLAGAVEKARKNIGTIYGFLLVHSRKPSVEENNVSLNSDFIAGLQDNLNDVVAEARAVKRQSRPVLKTLRKALMKE